MKTERIRKQTQYIQLNHSYYESMSVLDIYSLFWMVISAYHVKDIITNITEIHCYKLLCDDHNINMMEWTGSVYTRETLTVANVLNNALLSPNITFSWIVASATMTSPLEVLTATLKIQIPKLLNKTYHIPIQLFISNWRRIRHWSLFELTISGVKRLMFLQFNDASNIHQRKPLSKTFNASTIYKILFL